MWSTRGAGEFAENAFSAAANFGRTGIGHFFAPPHFHVHGKSRDQAKLWQIATHSSPLRPSEKKILGHHGDCWQGERSTKRVKRQPQNVLNLVRNQKKKWPWGSWEAYMEWLAMTLEYQQFGEKAGNRLPKIRSASCWTNLDSLASYCTWKHIDGLFSPSGDP